MAGRSVVNTIHTDGVVVYTIAAAPTKLLGIEEVGVDPNVSGILNYAAGDYLPSYTAVNQIEPICDYTLTDLANALTLINHMTGLGITGGTDMFEMYFTRKKRVGTREIGALHMKFSSKECLTYLEEITAVQGQDARARFRVCTIYDGTNEPLLITTTVSLPTPIAPLIQKYKLGKVLLNAVNVDGVTGVTYRTGTQAAVVFAGGDHRPTFVAIDRVEPVLEIRTVEVPHYSDYGITGTAGTGICTFYLYKRLKNSTVELDATAVHIKGTTTANFSRINMGRLTARNNENAEGVIQLHPVADGTNLPLVLSLTSAIT
jgi:hypothetical protein